MSDLYTMNPSQIVMYTTEYCSDCRRAKAYLEAKKISYLKVGLEGDDQATEFVIKINKGAQSVPTIIFPDGSVMVEPSLAELNRKFAKA